MADALSYRVLQAVVALLQKISTDNGFRTNHGQAFDLVDRNINQIREPVGLVREGADFQPNPESTTPRQRAGRMSVEIELAIPLAVQTAVRDAHNAREDILDALPSIAPELPKGATGLALEDRRIITRPDGADCIVVQVVVRVGLVDPINSALR